MKLILFALKEIYFSFIILGDSLIIRWIRPTKSPGKKKVLVLRIDRIGDFILWLDSAQALREIYPPDQYEITLLGNDLWSEIAKEIPWWDQVWALNRRRFTRNLLYRWRTLKKIREAGFDIVLRPCFSRAFYYEDAVVRASGACQRIGFSGDLSNITEQQKSQSDSWYTRLISSSQEKLMELRRNAMFIRELGLPSFQAKLPVFPMPLGSLKANTDGPYYIIFPGASRSLKEWPVDCFAEVARRIYNRTGWTGILCGHQGEKEIEKKLSQQRNPILKSFIGQTSLKELMGLIAGSRFVLGNDTGGIHMAAAVSTPSVCIVGGGHFGRFVPYQIDDGNDGPHFPKVVFHQMDCYYCNWQCIFNPPKGQPAPCIQKISVDRVWKGIEELLIEFKY